MKPESKSPKLSRRTALAGAGTAGALAGAAALLPAARTPQATAVAAVKPPQGDGYQETPHVLRYYQTARV